MEFEVKSLRSFEDWLLEIYIEKKSRLPDIRRKRSFRGNRGIFNSCVKTDFKIIYLDEADSFSDEAQAALRRTTEKYSENSRFVLSCSNSSKIIDPIRSRCVNIFFRPISKDNMREYIDKIAEEEGLDVEEDAVQTLIRAGKGDLFYRSPPYIPKLSRKDTWTKRWR